MYKPIVCHTKQAQSDLKEKALGVHAPAHAAKENTAPPTNKKGAKAAKKAEKAADFHRKDDETATPPSPPTTEMVSEQPVGAAESSPKTSPMPNSWAKVGPVLLCLVTMSVVIFCAVDHSAACF